MDHASFVHLHTHSEYSILDGAAKIDDLIKKAVQYNMPALALTDHGNMFGALEFYEKATAGGVKPIIGEEFYLTPGSMKKRGIKEKSHHLILLAKDEEGYRNLLLLSSMAYIEGFYYKPRIDKELLSVHADGLICMSSCLGGEIPSSLIDGRYEEARDKTGEYIDIFGKENFYYELMDNGLDEQKTVNRELLRLAEDLGVKTVATNDVHYLEKGDAQYHDALLCIQTGKSINEKKRLRFKSDEFYFRSPKEMLELFSEVPEAIRNTIEITEKCNLSLELGSIHLPNFPLPEGENAESYLLKLTEEGLKKRYKEIKEEIKNRADLEISVIKSMGFCTYFLIVWDFIRFAKSRGILVGPGRGSAAGSIVSYALGITNVDPLEYGLLFERFLNVSRISMPDIDIDFDGERRDEVIQYVREKYGEDKMAQIITFGAMKARAVVRDVARVMDIQLKDADQIAKMIPSRYDMTIKEALSTSRDLLNKVEKNPEINRLFEISRKLEKLVRHPSTHAAGVVISPAPLTTIVPLYKDPKSGVISTQFQAKYLEDVGLIKMDFLGLKNLTVIRRCLYSIEKAGMPVPDMDNLDLKDLEVYELLSAGKSLGIFQLESSGMQDLLKKVVPNRFDDIIAILALYRPGPLDSGMVDEFIERKHGRKQIEYKDPKLESVLKETYGVIVYQEQVMEIARVISGFTMAEADNLRKAMGKKKPEILEEAREMFIAGALKSGVDEREAEEIFDLIKTFGRYGFNKSHSTAYAFLAFQTAYLKVHYPLHYLASLLTGELNDTDKIAQYVNEAKEMNINVKAPDINCGGVEFSVDGDFICYALSALKNIGEGAARVIAGERMNGPYESLFDFTSRVDLRLVNRRVIESLIKSGTADCLGENKRTLFENIDRAMEYGASVQGDRAKGQTSLFEEAGMENITVDICRIEAFEEWADAEISENEKEILGFYFRAHPVEKYSDISERCGAQRVCRLKTLPEDSNVSVFGIIVTLKKIITRDNKEMAFLTLGDSTGSIESVIFPNVFEKYKEFIESKDVVVISGRVNGGKILADKIMNPQDFKKEASSQMHIFLNSSMDFEQLVKLRDIFLKKKGKCNIFLHMPELEKHKKAIKASAFLLVDPDEELISTLKREKVVEKVWVS